MKGICSKRDESKLYKLTFSVNIAIYPSNLNRLPVYFEDFLNFELCFAI